MTVLPEPDDAIIKFMEQLLGMTLLNAGYTIGQTLHLYDYQFQFENEDQILDETFLTIQNAIFRQDTVHATTSKLQTYGFSVRHCLGLSESDARLYMRDYIRNSVLLDTSEYREVILLCAAAALYYKCASCNRRDLMYIVTSEWARLLAGIPLPDPSALFSFVKELCEVYLSARRAQTSRERTVSQTQV